jgi:hypothetical protein
MEEGISEIRRDISEIARPAKALPEEIEENKAILDQIP